MVSKLGKQRTSGITVWTIDRLWLEASQSPVVVNGMFDPGSIKTCIIAVCETECAYTVQINRRQFSFICR